MSVCVSVCESVCMSVSVRLVWKGFGQKIEQEKWMFREISRCSEEQVTDLAMFR